jgi:serine/threonine protein kinase
MAARGASEPATTTSPCPPVAIRYESTSALDSATSAALAFAVSCLDSVTLTGWIDGVLSTAERERALAHIADCAPCREVTSALMRAAPAASIAPAAGEPAPAVPARTAVLEHGRATAELGDAALIERPSEAANLVRRGTGAVAVLPPPGYLLGEAIGRGGMGAVLAAQDLRIGREIAVKRMTALAPDSEQVGRFLREARIQARLEHPAIVPIHELGVDDQGRPFFTMKRITGQTLGRCLAEGAAQNRLLRVFVDVSRAIEFAHAHGIVHRDLKPSNIMLGDYGETYVIDWGIARVLAADREPPTPPGDIATLDRGATMSGAVLGTPGYMSPEQLRGQPATPAADIYSLGAILFEVLTGQSLHHRGQPAIAATLSTPQVRPSDRHPEIAIPPELDKLCFEALARLPDGRPRAHDLAEKVQAYLDGDRDLARRRELAAHQLAAARDLLASSDPDARASAMRRAGRAIALDPESEDAAELVSALLLEPPPEGRMPADLIRGLDEQERQINRDRSRRSVWAYLSVFGVLPLLLAMEVKNWGIVIGFYSLMLFGSLCSARFARRGQPSVTVVLIVNFGTALLFTRVAGPFVLTPLMVCCTLAAVTAIPWINQRPWVVMSWMAATVMIPIVFEWVGVLPRTSRIDGGHMIIISDVVRTHGRFDELALAIGNLLFTGVVAWLLVAINRRRRVGQRQLFILAWHLRQLLPQTRWRWPTQPR